jgi:hypothetical protein
MLKKESILDKVLNFQHCFICRPSDYAVGMMQGLNPGLLQRLHWQSDALTIIG